MELKEVRPEDKELLWNINQKYLYEMTNYYNDEMDEAGNLHYGYFDEYFTDPERKAFFIYDGDNLAGFVMIHPYSNIDPDTNSEVDGKADHVLAEFTVFPMYRGRHLATEAADAIFQRFKGRWEVKYNEKNIAAKSLWNKVTEKYQPAKLRLNNEETVLMFYTGRKIGSIRTGGQTGVDRAAMDTAREYGIPLCGWCPKGGWAEDYPAVSEHTMACESAPGLLVDYPELRETPSEGTKQRTQWNMRDADAILTIIPDGSLPSPGTDVGLAAGEELEKPMLTVHGTDDLDLILEWLDSLPDGIELCVGGPRASECKKAYDTARQILTAVLDRVAGKK